MKFFEKNWVVRQDDPKKNFFSKKNYSNLFCRAFRADHFGILFDGFKTILAKEKPKIRP